eukprot:GHVU01201215.1.p1 GENE.GHVU01201215.1~~GHVU01201215.1.p1  ORF type:complete len:274 (+),score=11.81 GHVU01201215.1:3-824(+)
MDSCFIHFLLGSLLTCLFPSVRLCLYASFYTHFSTPFFIPYTFLIFFPHACLPFISSFLPFLLSSCLPSSLSSFLLFSSLPFPLPSFLPFLLPSFIPFLARFSPMPISIQSFWRHWHKSFYVWIQRYAYIPLGGSKRKLYSIPIVFTFVAIWHEFSISLLAWGYLMVLSMIPEVLAHMWAKGVSTEMRSSRMWKLLICVGPAVNNMILILANLVGFSMGSSKSERSLATMYFTTAAIPFWLYTFIVISAKVPIVHTAREAQKDKENYMFGWYR